MIFERMSALCAAMGPAVANHLWQSTLCVIAAGLLTLTLRRNQAKIRYRLWLAASLKFLVPLSLLVSIGNHLAPSRPPQVTKPSLYVAVQQVSQPFSRPAPIAIHPAAPSAALPNLSHSLPAFFIVIWFCGFIAVWWLWRLRWQRVSGTLRMSVPLQPGREVNALRRLERLTGLRSRIDILLSPTSLEPGIFGIFRPVLVWPEGISDHLEDEHLEAILSHELLHVYRRDNLAAMAHMFVEAVFWFHPLVWWMGARLVEERERACDEEVLRFGNSPKIYAESVLKACEFCLRSPLACVSGITGADLKRRIVRIMEEHSAQKLNFAKKLLLVTIGFVTVTVPLLFGLMNPPPDNAESDTSNTAANIPSFEVVSIKPDKSPMGGVRFMFSPDGFTATNVTLKMLVKEAYGVNDDGIVGAPPWIDSNKYDIEAKVDGSAVDELSKLSMDQHKRMIQPLLADRFKMQMHFETKELLVYVLTIAKNGPKLQESKSGPPAPGMQGPPGTQFQDHKSLGPVPQPNSGMQGPPGSQGPHMMRITGRGHIEAQGVPLSLLTHLLSQQLGRTVIDKTGLTGSYDFTLKWTPDEGAGPMMKGPEGPQQGPDAAPPVDSSGPTIFTAVQEQLGLKLESQKGPVKVVVIDHAEPPSEN